MTRWSQKSFHFSKKTLSRDVVGAVIPTLRVDLLSGLPWAGSVQRGGCLFKEFGTCIAFWPDTCLVELTKSYAQVAKSYVQVAKSYAQVAKSHVQVAESYVPVAKSYAQVAKSCVQVAKFSSSVFL